MKKYFPFIVLLFITVTFSQTQERISWPSLAKSPWPMIKGDPHGTGRSKFVGPTTNNILWVKDMPHGIVHGPVIGFDDELYFGTRAISADSNYFYALNSDGTERWKFRTEDGYPNWGAAIIGKDSTIYFPSNNSFIYALDRNGKQKWKTGPLSIGSKSLLSISKSGNLFISTWADSMVVIDNKNGKIKFKKYIGNSLNGNQFTFSYEGDKIFYVRSDPGSGDNYYIGSLDTSGNLGWQKQLGYTSTGMPVIDDQNNIYLLTTINTFDIGLVSLNSNGNLRWIYELYWFEKNQTPSIDNDGNIILAAPKIVNDEYKYLIYSISYDGELNWNYIIDSSLNWENTKVNSHITIDAEGKIYFGSTDGGYFYCLNKEGELLWKIYLEGNDFDSSPAIGSDGTLYIASHSSSTNQNQKRTLIAIKDDPNSVEDEETPREFELLQNYPNPFNPTTNIKFTVATPPHPSPYEGEGAREGLVVLRVYDILGREVTTLVNEVKPAGNYEVEFNGSNLSSGMYFYRLTSGSFTQTRKMLLIK